VSGRICIITQVFGILIQNSFYSYDTGIGFYETKKHIRNIRNKVVGALAQGRRQLQ
jgi:hypothetical protein